MYRYRITDLTLSDGTTAKPQNLSVIVGPNNSGKSRALKEILAITTTPTTLPRVVVKDVKWTIPSNIDELRESYEVERYQSDTGGWNYRCLRPDLTGEFSMGGGPDWPDGYQSQLYRGSDPNFPFFAQFFGNAMIGFLSTEQRLQFVKESDSPASEKQTSNVLHAIYNSGPQIEKSIRELVKRTFVQEVALDFSTLHRILFRVGPDFSSLPPDPRDAKPILSKCEKLDEQGDGIRSFVGIVAALMSLKRDVFLIDEPEAFLHPPQAFRIGEFLSDQTDNSRQIIIATHSADVLRGILSKTQEVSIIRLDRTGGTNRFDVLDPGRLKELVTDPLLSSARVLDGLFYSGAVVVEADSDARFYHAVSKNRRPDLDLHFVNADNKQTVPRITSLYRDMGVRCVGIVDFDVLNDSTEFKRQLEALHLNSDQHKQAVAIREEIATAAKELPPDERLEGAKQQLTDLLTAVNEIQGRSFGSRSESVSAMEKMLLSISRKSYQIADSTKVWRELKQNGRAALPSSTQTRFDVLWEICAGSGLIINPCGELESLLMEYGIPVTTDKRSWIVQALKLIPSLTVDKEKYPWKLMVRIHQFLTI